MFKTKSYSAYDLLEVAILKSNSERLSTLLMYNHKFFKI